MIKPRTKKIILGTVSCLAVVGLLVTGYYGYQLRTQNRKHVVAKSKQNFQVLTDQDQNMESATDQSFVNLQWGLVNNGTPQNIDLDGMITYRHQAKPGEDIQLPTPVVANKKILVAVLDTGVDFSHPDLQNVIHTKPSECAALEKFLSCVETKDRKSCEKTWMDLKNPEVDQDKNGYPLDCHGWSFTGKINEVKILGQPDFDDSQGHGTHVTGIIAAQIGNDLGINGVSSNVEILPVQVISNTKPNQPLKPMAFNPSPIEGKPIPVDGDGNVRLAELMSRAIKYSISSGAQVISMSLGWPDAQDTESMREVVREAQKRGIIIVAAAGNDSTKALLRPCSYEGVICVGAQRPDGAMAHFSNYGSGVDISAPGINILGTYPMDFRPVLFRFTYGYEYMSGTSQAVPFVSGVVAEMLARGIPSSEVYARLVLGARPLSAELPLLSGSPHETGKVLKDSTYIPYKKYVLSGNLDFKKALQVKPQALILPREKEKNVITWDRKSAQLKFKFHLMNHWQDIATSQVSVQGNVILPHSEAVRPRLVSLKPTASYPSVWTSREIREYEVTLMIDDVSNPELTRIGSEFEVDLSISTGQNSFKYILQNEIVVPFTSNFKGADITNYPVQNFPKGQISWIPVYKNLDEDKSRHDYFLVLEGQQKYQVWVARQDSAQGPYRSYGGETIKINADPRDVSDRFQVRTDWDFDGQSDYILGYFVDKSEDQEAKTSPMSFFVFDKDMQLKQQFIYNDDRAQMSFNIQWMRINGRKMPAWVNQGRDPNKTRDLWDIWTNPDNDEQTLLRFYYLDEDHKLQALSEHNGYKIIDLLNPRADQEQAGRVPVLLAKNLGTEITPSYLYDFAVAEVYNGKIENFREMDFFSKLNTYRNLLDTSVDKILSLNPLDIEFNGTFWFGPGRPREQRVSLFDSYDFAFADYQLPSMRPYFDGALWTRAVYSGNNRQAAFVFTNSEIQYHDLLKNKVYNTSMERYSFFPRDIAVNMQFPVVVKDKSNPNLLVPALMNPEGSGLNKGIKLIVPRYTKDGRVVELMSPARLRFTTNKETSGCRSLDAPFFGGAEGSFVDYFCGDRIMRVNFSY